MMSRWLACAALMASVASTEGAGPVKGTPYLSFDRGPVRASVPSVVRVDSTGKVEAVPLRDVAFTKVSMPSPAPVDPRRPGPNDQGLSVNELAYVDGRLYVAGLSGDKF